MFPKQKENNEQGEGWSTPEGLFWVGLSSLHEVRRAVKLREMEGGE